jgi:hypothetical protein
VFLVAIFVLNNISAGAQTIAKYSVTLLGNVQGNPFTRQGTLTVARTISPAGTQNGVNPIEVFLQSGNPPSFPQTGAIWFMTNSGMQSPNGARIDYAYVSTTRSSITVIPDRRVTALGNNVFNYGSSIISSISQIRDGKMELRFNENNVSGTVRVSGLLWGGILGASQPYYASITGVRTQLTALPAKGDKNER